MSLMPHLGLWILALNLSLNGPALALPQPLPLQLRIKSALKFVGHHAFTLKTVSESPLGTKYL